MTNETKSWIVGCLRAGCIFSICTVLAILARQHPKFYLHAVLAIVAAGAFAAIAWLFRPLDK